MSAHAPPQTPEQAPPVPPHPRPLLSPGGGWRSAIREFAVIVAGVLAALAGQAWWESAQAREREEQYLVQLLDDTRENSRRLEEAIAEDSAAAAAIAAVMRAMHAPAPLPPDDTLLLWVRRAGANADFKPVTGSYGALLTTGDLRLLRTDSLRTILVAYAGSLEGETLRQNQIRGGVLELVRPMAEALPFLRTVFLGDVVPPEPDFEALRGDPEGLSVLFSMQALNVNRIAGLRRLRSETQRLERALEAEPALAGGR